MTRIPIKQSVIMFGLGLATSAFGQDPAPARNIASPLRAGVSTQEGVRALSIDVDLLAEAEKILNRDGRIQLLGLPLPNNDSVDLTLEPITPFDLESRIEVMTARGMIVADLPQTIIMAGTVTDEPNSEAFLAFTAAGIEGWVRTNDVSYGISDGHNQTPSIHRMDLFPGLNIEDFCQADHIKQPGPIFQPPQTDGDDLGGVAGFEPGPACRRLRLAIETDQEFLGLFSGDRDEALGYVATLISASSYIYGRDVNLRFGVSYLRLWETDDPWTQGSTGDQLYEFRDSWQASQSDVPRDLAHFVSGRGLGGGVAWLGVLCGSGYEYALSANMNGSFPYPIENNSGSNWDLMVFNHELGHNLGAPHTHDLNPPVDSCASGDCSVTPSGTIMSYCHLCDGGLANVQMRFCPENIGNMNVHISNVSCDYEVEDSMMCADDEVTTYGSTPVIIDVLQNDTTSTCMRPELEVVSDTSTQGGQIQILEEWGPDGYSAILYTAPAGFVGSDSFIYEARSGNIDGVGTVNIDVEGLRPPENPSGTEPGVEVTYYALDQLSELPDFSLLDPIGSEIVANIDYPSTGGAFMGSGLNDDVGAVFTGWMKIDTTGDWTFGTESDDGSRLYIGDQVVVENDGLHGMVERTGTIGLEAGWHAIRVEFFERGGGAGLIVRSGGPDTTYQVISSEDWAHGGSSGSGADLNGDGTVDGADLGLLLAQWGSSGSGDLNGDGTVDGGDIGLMLVEWSGE